MPVLHRRAMLLGSTAFAAVPLILDGCGATGAMTPAQLLADARGVEAGLMRALPVISTLLPKLLPPTGPTSLSSFENSAGTGYLDLASALLSGLSPTSPADTSAGTLATVEKYFNLALDAVAPVTPALAAVIPGLGPVVAIVDAAVVLVPVIEAFVNSVPTVKAGALAGKPAAARAAARAPSVKGVNGLMRPMTVPDARALLGVPTP